MSDKKWIQKALPPSSKGKLHEQLHVPQGEKIPEKKLEKAAHSSNPTLAKRAHLAETLKSFHHHKAAKEAEHHAREKEKYGL